jgi:leader peptidase (prepilin peptidase) / N-methyltransferase
MQIYAPGTVEAVLALAVLGLLIGSFLNVVVYRLPIMYERKYEDYALMDAGKEVPERERFDLFVPGSRCSNCGHQIRWYENIPVFSYLALRGKCSACGVSYGLRYPLVELCTGLLFAFVGWKHGLGAVGIAWCAFTAIALVAGLMDWDTTQLPNSLTMPLLMLGLGVSAAGGNPEVGMTLSVWGAVIGFGLLWSVAMIWGVLRGVEAMAEGDFVLMAALGAWFGALGLIPVLLIASITGVIVGLAMKFSSGLVGGKYVPFGPFLVLGGLVVMLFGPRALLAWTGLQ